MANKLPLFFSFGEMSERFKVQSWKGCVPKGTGGSNPPLSEKDKYYCRILSLKKAGDSNGKPRRASARKSKQDAYDSGLRRVGGANRTLATETKFPCSVTSTYGFGKYF